jgi:hypothetical protein
MPSKPNAKARTVRRPATSQPAGVDCPIRCEQVVWRVLDGKGILLLLDAGEYFELDPIGLAIWEACDGKTSTTRIAATVAKRFGADTARVERDLAELVAELRKSKLLREEASRDR